MSAPQRYAAALLGNLPESAPLQTQALLQLQASVAALAEAIKAPSILAALKNPRLTPAQRQQFATSCAKAAEAPQALKGLLLLLAANRRLNMLPEVLAEVLAQIAAKQGVVPVEVHSAQPITEMQKIQLKLLLKKQTKARDVALHEVVKPALVGGFRAFYNGMVWDTSVAGKLTRLKASLKHAANL
jgi:F-type H+-transporting ATPase subunit delta